ncbi:hypothetical protein GWI33_004125 [Rhynchophorus ferrugineus]|uniref:Uncharacterized protein n=1 Tax=Rhynchophorus ferrugineus TaxID=354439 RepID=A0A834M2L6_RHYFE|nr:hypothetical protein GWI33_004125 [Rhynchophorus ferrugineus]
MDKSALVILLNKLVIRNVNSLESKFANTFEELCRDLKCTEEDIITELKDINQYYFSSTYSAEWRNLLCIFYVFSKIGKLLKFDDTQLLSVKEITITKKAVAYTVKTGIYEKLLPKLPFSLPRPPVVNNDIFYEYNILKCAILAFYNLLKNEHLRTIILTEAFIGMLSGLYQIAYCPIKKDLKQICHEDIYERIHCEKKLAITILTKLKENIHPSIYVKNTMIIFQENSPLWFKKAVSQTLTNIMLSSTGIEYIAIAMLSGTGNDKSHNWKALDILYKLISSCKFLPDFKDNICKQVIGLLENTNEDCYNFERLFVTCTRRFYSEYPEIGKDIFLRKVISELLHFTYKGYTFVDGSCTLKIKKNIRLIHAIFVERSIDSDCLPIEILKPVLGVLFRIFVVTLNSPFKITNSESKHLIRNYIDQVHDDIVLFDALLFNIHISQQILPFRNDIQLGVVVNEIMLTKSEHNIIYSLSENSEALMKIVSSETKILKRLFIYLLNCLDDEDKYFKKGQEDLLAIENDISGYFEKAVCVYRLLSTLAEDKYVQKMVVESPEEIVVFIKNTLEKTLQDRTHITRHSESEQFQRLFLVVMVLNALVNNDIKQSQKHFKELISSLQIIKDETDHVELSTLIEKILEQINISESKVSNVSIEETKSKFDLALEDICDPLLPVRGHGLMALKKLVEIKDESVMHRKQYVLTIFQQNIKNEDSFIYLNAIDGLAALFDIFPDTVLNTLCDEYADFTKRDKKWDEVRMKLGEVLVRITKLLGEMGSKYKALLLNTFLNGTKDDDHLVRASALSNLGEICRVLGYKLGNIITEVLVCVHAIVTTDKAIEPRRAAVTVIRQLFVGLESETIEFLKDEILQIYRTLKTIYNTDKDDVMRLQAQLALEELNENMKNYVFPKPELNLQKKIIMLD